MCQADAAKAEQDLRHLLAKESRPSVHIAMLDMSAVVVPTLTQPFLVTGGFGQTTFTHDTTMSTEGSFPANAEATIPVPTMCAVFSLTHPAWYASRSMAQLLSTTMTGGPLGPTRSSQRALGEARQSSRRRSPSVMEKRVTARTPRAPQQPHPGTCQFTPPFSGPSALTTCPQQAAQQATTRRPKDCYRTLLCRWQAAGLRGVRREERQGPPGNRKGRLHRGPWPGNGYESCSGPQL